MSLKDREARKRYAREWARKRAKKPTPEYKAWTHMIGRCENPNDHNFRDYGARGVSICPEWRSSFVAFLRDVGPRPSAHHSINRLDNDGNYQPGNVGWATRTEQNGNTRRNRRLTVGGRTMILSDWARETGLLIGTLWSRLELGWSDEKTVTTRPIWRGQRRADVCA